MDSVTYDIVSTAVLWVLVLVYAVALTQSP